MKCELCNDTGSLTTDGYLDCVACYVAIQRAEFNKRLKEAGSMSVEDAAWWGRQDAIVRFGNPVAYLWSEGHKAEDTQLGAGDFDEEICFGTEPPIPGTPFETLYMLEPASKAYQAPQIEDIDLTWEIAGKISEFYPQETPRDMEKNHRLARAIQRMPMLREVVRSAINKAIGK